MKTFARSLTMVTLLALAGLAAAHTRLVQSLPADASQVVAPARLELEFSDLSQLQSVRLQRDGEPARDLQPLPQEWGSKFAVPLPQLSTGDYVATWTVETDDGHKATGKVRFTVVAAAEAGSAPHH
jgi:methionine-rich copper-binding protein CopC